MPHSCPSPDGVHLWDCTCGPECGYDDVLLCHVHRDGANAEDYQAYRDAMAILDTVNQGLRLRAGEEGA